MIKHFIKYYKPHMPLFLLDFTSAFLVALLDLVFPKAVNIVIDKVLPKNDIQLVFRIGIFLFVLYIIRYILGYVVHYYGHVLGTKIEYDMRQDIFGHVQKLSFAYFDNTKTGHIMSRIVNDLNDISELAHHGPEDFFISAITLLGTFFILIQTNWQLTVIIFAIMPFMAWFAFMKNREMRSAFKNTRVKIADINAQVEDSISGIREVKAFANEEHEQIKFEHGNKDFRVATQKAFKIMAEFFSGIDLMTNLINLLVLTAGGWLCYRGKMTIGDLVGFLLYVSMFLQPLRRMMNLLESFQKGMAGFGRFIEVMETQPDIVDNPGATDLNQVKGRITFDNVTFSYDNKSHVFSNVSFKIEPGETIAFVGPSGAGKTTLVSLIPRFYEVDDGIIKIDGIDTRNVTLKSLRQNIGIVQQNVFLFAGTVRYNIAYGRLDATDEEIVEAAKRANAHNFIMELENGYDTYIGERGVKLSGGQKQRLSIARIFLKNPPILILDEATSALDNETEKTIQESLFALSQNRTTLIIAHRLATIRHAGRIFVLTEEGIIEQGTHKELLERKGAYHRLYATQFEN
jgi:ATP-binding cassette subfamily B protein